MMPWDDHDAADDVTIKWVLRRTIFDGSTCDWAEGEVTFVTIGQKSNPKYGSVMAFPKGFNPELDQILYVEV